MKHIKEMHMYATAVALQKMCQSAKFHACLLNWYDQKVHDVSLSEGFDAAQKYSHEQSILLEQLSRVHGNPISWVRRNA